MWKLPTVSRIARYPAGPAAAARAAAKSTLGGKLSADLDTLLAEDEVPFQLTGWSSAYRCVTFQRHLPTVVSHFSVICLPLCHI